MKEQLIQGTLLQGYTESMSEGIAYSNIDTPKAGFPLGLTVKAALTKNKQIKKKPCQRKKNWVHVWFYFIFFYLLILITWTAYY